MVIKNSQTRLFITQGAPGPSNPPIFIGCGAVGKVNQPGRPKTPVYCPDPNKYDSFIIVDEVAGQPGMPTLDLDGRLAFALSKFLDLTKKGCEFNVHAHAGSCKDPTDFDSGFELGLLLEHASSTGWALDSFGALDASKNAPVTEAMPTIGRNLEQLAPMLAESIGDATITDEVMSVAICDSVSCGDCGPVSDGCQHVFALQRAPQGSPGLPAKLIYTKDGGATFGSSVINTLNLGEIPTKVLCVGPYVVVVSDGTSCAIHYAKTADLINGVGSWTKNTTGFSAAGCPISGFSLGRVRSWYIGLGGYVYFSQDPTGPAIVQAAGVPTTQNLADIDGLSDGTLLVAVGASNAVIASTNGGTTWATITGPAVGIALTTVAVRTSKLWWIGTANGHIYWTEDGGISWTEKVFSGTANCVVKDFSFATESVGFMAVNMSGTNLGRLYRTTNAGASWVVSPEDISYTYPANGGLNAIATCGDPNVVYAGGATSVGGTDGILIKASGKPAAWIQ